MSAPRSRVVAERIDLHGRAHAEAQVIAVADILAAATLMADAHQHLPDTMRSLDSTFGAMLFAHM